MLDVEGRHRLMLVLVASGDVNPSAPEQQSSTVAGELVIPVESCTCVAPCWCRRSWFGIASGGATPIAVVADRSGVEPHELRQIVADHLVHMTELPTHDTDVDAVLDELHAITQRFSDGARLARVGDHVTEMRVTADD